MTRRDPEIDLKAARAKLAQVLEVARRAPAPYNEPIVSGPPPVSTLQRKLLTWGVVALLITGLYLAFQHKTPTPPRPAPAASAPDAAPAVALPGQVRTNPDWLRRPTGEDLYRYYPYFARVLRKEGRATVRCRVAVSGRVEDCVVVSEDPRGWGFGKATLAMSKDFPMRPATVDGQPVGDGEVTIPIHFAP
jgi:TonB family protein